MNHTVKEATIKAFHYPDLESLKAHVLAFVSAYNFATPPKAPVEHPLRSRLSRPDNNAPHPQAQPTSPHPGTKHLDKAVFAITATTEYSEEAVTEAVEKWGHTLE